MTVKTFNLVVLLGDGVSLEVVPEAVRVLRAVEKGMKTVGFSVEEYPCGAEEYARGGIAMRPKTWKRILAADAVLAGSMGGPDIRDPAGREIQPDLDIREKLDLTCNLRPARLYHEADTPLKGAAAGTIDLLILRESTEGLLSERTREVAPEADEVTDVLKVTRKATERIFRAAFEQARRRRKKVTLVDKADALPSMAFFRKVFDEVASGVTEVDIERLHVDAAARHLVRRPADFDVLVAQNPFADILSDVAMGLVGGMGMAASAYVGGKHGLFQPIHGTAPDIAGKGIANPLAAILTAAMMLDWLDHPETVAGAKRLRGAVGRVLADPKQRTPDMGGALRTAELADLVIREVEA